MKIIAKSLIGSPAIRSRSSSAALKPRSGVKWWIALGVALAFMAASEAQAHIYKWVDADGKVQYSQTPPPDGQYREVEPGPPPSQSSDDADRQLRSLLRRQEESEKQDEAAGREKRAEAAQQAKLDQRCAKAKEELTLLENNPAHRLAVTENGVVERRMSEDERQTKIAKTKKVISEVCE